MMAFTMRRKPRSLATVSSVHFRLVFRPLKRSTFNVQAFIRRASSMADKTSWTKPRAPMTYGDSIATPARLEAGTVGDAGGGQDRRPPFAGASAPGDGVPDGVGDASPGPRAMRAQRTGVAAGGGRPGAGGGRGARRGSRGVPGGGRGGQPLDLPEQSLLTDRTALDVETGDAQHQVPGRLRRHGGRGRLGQQGPALREGRRPSAIGGQDEVGGAGG